MDGQCAKNLYSGCGLTFVILHQKFRNKHQAPTVADVRQENRYEWGGKRKRPQSPLKRPKVNQ